MRIWMTPWLSLCLIGCRSQATSTDLCDVAKSPESFIGRELSVVDVVLADGHGDPFLIPDRSCPAYRSFPVIFHDLETLKKAEFVRLIRTLNTTIIDGHGGGLSGRYAVRVLNGPPGLEISILDASQLRVVDGEEKTRSLHKQVPPEPSDS